MAEVVAVALSPRHGVNKRTAPAIALRAGLGVDGDAHWGALVKHRSRARADPTQTNLRQVHLIHAELFGELAEQGFTVTPGRMGENVTTRGIDLLALPRGARLRLGPAAVVEVTGLRNPCSQLNGVAPGLMKATLGRTVDGALIRKAGVMAVVVEGGAVRPGDAIVVLLPPAPHVALEPV